MTHTLHHGDCLEVLRTMPACSVDACVTDPPYGLSFMGKAWDYDVPSVDVWREVLRVLKPGGHHDAAGWLLGQLTAEVIQLRPTAQEPA